MTVHRRRVRARRIRALLERLSIRGVVFVGFSLILALWVISAADLVRQVVEVERRTADVHTRFTRSEELLTTVRTEIPLASVYLRDALLDTPDKAAYYEEQLQQVRAAIDRALTTYMPVIDSQGERETFGQLRAEIEEFWNTVVPAVNWDTERRVTQTRRFLRERVIPRRQVIISIAGRVQRLNRAAFEEQQAQLARIYSNMRRRVWQTSVAVLLLGIGVAVFVVRQSGRLERRIQQQRIREHENARNLQRLSAQLVHVQEEERRSIARELHDEIGQALTAIKVELSLVERALEPAAKERAAIGEARSITDGALHAVRDLSQLLHPPLLDDLGLAATIDWYLRSFSNRTHIVTELIHEGLEERLVPEVEICLYRIVQEALTNVARHSEATSCRLYLRRLPDTILVTVEDNGKGFDVQQASTPDGRRGLGLLGIRERAAGFGGAFRVESVPGRGTRLTVELPALHGDAADEKRDVAAAAATSSEEAAR